jgi:multiple sugar transport system ATP-binding protein
VTHVVLEKISKVYPDGTSAVSDLDLEIHDGELLVLVGPSGCGKTTALRMVAGLEDVSSGRILIGDRDVSRVPSRDRDVAMVFQSYALYPHLTVGENIGFGLKLRKMPKDVIRDRVNNVAGILGLEDLLDRKPRNLSGGQRQRVAMGRAIVREPQAFLMDEPLSNLDAKLRVQMRAEIARIQARLGVTTIYVTHDQTEAMTLGDRVAVMKKGVLQQVDPPQVLYDRPVNLFVAGFIGSPAMNLLEATLERSDDNWHLLLGSHRVDLDPALFEARPGLAEYDGRTLIVGIRPEDISDADLTAGPPGSQIEVEAELVEAMGSDVLVHVTLDVPQILTDDARELAADAGTDVEMMEGNQRNRRSPVVARLSPRTAAREGAPVRLSLDTGRLHAFDPSTGAAIWDTPVSVGAGQAPDQIPQSTGS